MQFRIVYQSCFQISSIIIFPDSPIFPLLPILAQQSLFGSPLFSTFVNIYVFSIYPLFFFFMIFKCSCLCPDNQITRSQILLRVFCLLLNQTKLSYAIHFKLPVKQSKKHNAFMHVCCRDFHALIIKIKLKIHLRVHCLYILKISLINLLLGYISLMLSLRRKTKKCGFISIKGIRGLVHLILYSNSVCS